MKDLEEIKLEIERLAKLIGAEARYLPTCGHPIGDGTPYIEIDARGYNYVQSERGHEFERWTTTDLEKLLYQSFKSATFQMATEYEVKHRIAGRDCRRMTYVKQKELMSQLPEKWGRRLAREIEMLLAMFPFDDNSSVRAQFARKLREDGRPADEATRIAEEKHPSPPRGTMADGKRLLDRMRDQGW